MVYFGFNTGHAFKDGKDSKVISNYVPTKLLELQIKNFDVPDKEEKDNVPIQGNTKWMENTVDGGRGWVVVIACFVCNLILEGTVYCVTTFLDSILPFFGASRTAIAIMQAMMKGIYNCGSLLVSGIITKYGCGITCVAGSITTCFALSCLCFVNNVIAFGIIYCLVLGFGLCMIHVPANIAPGSHFKLHRGKAMGVVSAGSALGGILSRRICNQVTNQIVWQKAYIILAIVVPLCILCGNAMNLLNTMEDNGAAPGEDDDGAYNKRTNQLINTVKADSATKSVVKNGWSAFKQFASFSLIKNPTFLLICMRNMTAFVALYHADASLVDFMIKAGYDKTLSSAVIARYAWANCLGRYIGGHIADFQWANSHAITNVSLLVCGLANFVIPYCTMYTQFFCCTIIYGFAIGPLISLTPVTLIEEFGLENLTISFGIIEVFIGIGNVIGLMLSGVLADSFDHLYAIQFTAGGALLVLASIIGVFAHIKPWYMCTEKNQTNQIARLQNMA